MLFTQLSKSEIEFTGTYSVLAELAKRGWTANLTPGTSKNTDIIAYKEINGETIYRRIEVKTTTRNFRALSNTKDISGPHTFWNVGNIEKRNLKDIIYIFVSIKLLEEKEMQKNLEKRIAGINFFIDSEKNIYEIRFYIVPSYRVQEYLYDARIFRQKHECKSYTYMRIGPGRPNEPGSTIKDEETLSRWELLEHY